MLKSLIVALFGVALVMGVQGVAGRGRLLPATTVLDYRVYACGARAMLHGDDPYRTEPLRACEHRVAPGRDEPAWGVTPFCLPPYAVFFLAPFGIVPFAFGRAVWFALILLATGVSAVAIARTIAKPAFLVAIVLTGLLGTLNLLYGETVPFAIAAIALGGLALQRDRPALAGIACAAALLEPAIGLPAAIGLFALRPRARPALLAGVAVLAAASAALGIPRNVEYLTAFLPAHQRAELLASDQYGIAHVAYVLGGSAHAAALIASVTYLLAIAAGVIVARRLVARTSYDALVVLLPVATSMLGSPFAHNVEITSALPAALVLAAFSRTARVAFVALVAGLVVGWRDGYVPVIAAVLGLIALFAREREALQAVAYTAIATVSLLVLDRATVPKLVLPIAIAIPPDAVAADSLSSRPWELEILAAGATRAFDPKEFARKAPTWLALAALPFALVPRRRRAPSVERDFATVEGT